MQNPDLDLLRRLERLEQQNSRLTRVLAVGGALCIGVLVAAACDPGPSAPADSAPTTADSAPAATAAAATSSQAGKFETLEVEKLILRDRYGRQAALLETDPDRGTVLTLFDEQERAGLRLGVTPRITEMVMSSDGTRRLDTFVSPDGGVSTLRMYDANELVVFQANTEGGATSAFLMGPPDDKGVRSNIGLRMPPSGQFPHLTARNTDLTTKIWTLEEQ